MSILSGLQKLQRATKGLEEKTYEEQLRSLGLLSVEDTEGRPHRNLQLHHKVSEGAGANLFSLMTSNRTRGNRMKLDQGRFKLDVRKMFLTLGVRHWNKLPRELITASSLLKYKKCLDNTLRNRV